MTRVVLIAGSRGNDYVPYVMYPVIPDPCRVFDIPTARFDRWNVALAGFVNMQADIEALIDARESATRPAR